MKFKKHFHFCFYSIFVFLITILYAFWALTQADFKISNLSATTLVEIVYKKESNKIESIKVGSQNVEVNLKDYNINAQDYTLTYKNKEYKPFSKEESRITEETLSETNEFLGTETTIVHLKYKIIY